MPARPAHVAVPASASAYGNANTINDTDTGTDAGTGTDTGIDTGTDAGTDAADQNAAPLSASPALGTDDRADDGPATTGLYNMTAGPVPAWRPRLSQLVSRYAGYLDHFQIGRDDDAQQFADDPRLRQADALLGAHLATLVQSPDLTMPWPAWYELPAQTAGPITLAVSPDILPQQLPLYLTDLRRRGGDAPTLSLRPLDRSRYGRIEQIRDLARRVAFALAGGAERIDLPLPLSVDPQADDASPASKQPQPDELFMIQRTLATTLAGATFRGQVPIEPGIEAFLFDRAGVGVLMLWNKDADEKGRTVDITLGQRPVRLDLWGNATPVVQPAKTNGAVPVAIGPTPFFLIGVDGQLALLRASVAIDQPMIESSFEPHTRKIRFKNPYSFSISGEIRITGPKGWTATVANPVFTLAAGAVYESQVTLEFPYNSLAGEKILTADLKISAQSDYALKIPIALKLGLGDVGVETIALRDAGGLVVQQMITNYGTKPANYTSFILLPGQARQERLVSDLKPGATMIKKYRFASLPGRGKIKLQSGLRETDGTRTLNSEVTAQ